MFRGHLGWISRFFWFVDCVLGARTDYLNCGKPSASGGTEMEAEAWSASVKRAKSLAFALDHSSELMQYSSCQWDNMFIVLWVRQHTKMNLSGYKGLLLQIALDWIPQTKFAVPVFAGSASAKVSAEEGSKRRQELCFLWIHWIFFISLIFSQCFWISPKWLDQRITVSWVSCEPLQDKVASEVEASFAGWKGSEILKYRWLWLWLNITR